MQARHMKVRLYQPQLRKKVNQDKFSHENGNCLAACFASIFGSSLTDMPDFWNLGPDTCHDFWNCVDHYLHQKGMIWRCKQLGFHEGCLHIRVGASPRGQTERDTHAVLCQNDVLVHDPHHERSGLKEPLWEMALYTIRS